jgi:hypothetical protein
MLSDLADGVQDVAGGYDEAVERDVNGSTRDVEENTSSAALIMKSSLLFSESAAKFTLTRNWPPQIWLNPCSSWFVLLIDSMGLTLTSQTWRHLLYYANDALHPTNPVRPVDISLSFSVHTRLDSSRSTHASARALELVASGLRGVLDRLDELNGDIVRLIVSSLVDEISTDNQALELRGKQNTGNGYYGMLVRRLKELCSALVNGQEQEGGDMDED